MKKIYVALMSLSALIFTTNANAQSSTSHCGSSRYQSEVFSCHNLTSGVTYGKNGSTTLKLDVYQPDADTAVKRPLIVWAHGGSFIGGTRTDADVVELSKRFARRGYVCVSIDYRVGFFPFDSANATKASVKAVQDMKAAVRFFYRDASTTNVYKIDTNNIFVGGSSAGAFMALHYAYLDRSCEIDNYFSTSALNALGGLDGASGNPCYSQKVNGVINLCGALGSYSWLEAGDLPFVSMHGTSDGTVPYSRNIANSLLYTDGSRMLNAQAVQVGVSNPFYTWRGADHVPYAGSSATQVAYMDTTENFVGDYLYTRLGCTVANPNPIPNTPYGTPNLYAYTPCAFDSATAGCTIAGQLSPAITASAGVKTCLASGINTIDSDISNVYPVPSSESITVDLKKREATVALYDIAGKLIKTYHTSTQRLIINKETIEPGVYFLQITDNNGKRETRKVIFN